MFGEHILPKAIADVKERQAGRREERMLRLACPKRSYGARKAHHYGARAIPSLFGKIDVKERQAGRREERMLRLACPKRSYGARKAHHYGARTIPSVSTI